MQQTKISELSVSTRLAHVLSNYHIVYLQDVTKYSYEELMQFRNMGKKTMQELTEVCAQKGIPVSGKLQIDKGLRDRELPRLFLAGCTENAIKNISELDGETVQKLFELCSREYTVTMNVYYILQKRGIRLAPSEYAYTFEYMERAYSRRLWERIHIKTMQQLTELDGKDIKSIRGIGQISYKKIGQTIHKYKREYVQ